MRKILALLFALLITTQCRSAPNFFLGPQVEYLKVNIGGFDSDYNGWLYGGIGGFEYRCQNDIYAAFIASYAKGIVRNSGNPERDIQNILIEARIGYEFSFCCGEYIFTPYVGYGNEMTLHDRTGGGVSRLKLSYDKYYFPIGFILDFKPSHYFKIGLEGEFLWDIAPELNIDGIDGVNYQLSHGYDIFIKLPFRLILWDCTSFDLVPFYRYEKSGGPASAAPGILGGILTNTYNYYGAYAALNFNF